MTDDQKDLLKIGADTAIKPFANLVEELFGGSVEELGGMWQDALKVRRFGRQLSSLREYRSSLPMRDSNRNK